MSESKLLCFQCGSTYSTKEIGTLQCRIHPLKHNDSCTGKQYARNHYECCGATKAGWDIVHYELSDPKGCHRIDHVASREELERIQRRPYVCVPASETGKLAIFEAQASKPQYVIPVLEEDNLEYFYSFNLLFGRTCQIDLRYEHAALVGKLRESMPKTIAEDGTQQLYSSELDDIDEVDYVYKTDFFCPFYVVRRMDFDIDKEKKAEIRAASSCSEVLQ